MTTTRKRTADPASDIAPHRRGTQGRRRRSGTVRGGALLDGRQPSTSRTTPTDAELVDWWQQSGNRTSGVVSGVFAICAAVLFAVVLNYLAALRATARAPHWTAFARSMGAAVTAVWLVTGAARAAVGHLVDVMDEPLPDVDVLRFATALNYTLLGLSGMGALGAHASSPSRWWCCAPRRWDGGSATSEWSAPWSILAATLAQYGAYTTPLAIAWAFCLAVAIWRQPQD